MNHARLTTTDDVLHQLHDAGLTVRAHAGKLLISPKSRITPELRELVRQHLPALLVAANDTDHTAILHFKLIPSGGGTLIDHDGELSALQALASTYTAFRVDWLDLLDQLHGPARAEAERLAQITITKAMH